MVRQNLRLLDHAFCIAANIRFDVNGTSRILTPTASKIALAIAAGTGTVASSPAPSEATSCSARWTRS